MWIFYRPTFYLITGSSLWLAQTKMGRGGDLFYRSNICTHSWPSVPSLPLAVSHEHQLGVMPDRNKGRCTLWGAFVFSSLSMSAWVTGVRSKYSGRNSSSVFRELRDKKVKKQGGEVFWVITPSFSIAILSILSLSLSDTLFSSLSLPFFLSPSLFFPFFLFWQVLQPPIHGKHTLHILQTRVFREEIERKLCRKCKKNPSLRLCLCSSLHTKDNSIFT